MCFLTMLKPMALVCWMSHTMASSVGGVSSPSGQ